VLLIYIIIDPYQSITNKNPDEVLFNKVVDILHLKVFGGKGFFSYNNHKFKKFDNNTKGIFIDYDNDFLGYKILYISTNSIINYLCTGCLCY